MIVALGLSGPARGLRLGRRRIGLRPRAFGPERRILDRHVELHQLAQIDQRQEPVAQAQDRGVVDPLDGVLGVGRGTHQLEHGDLRDRETLAPAPNDQRRDDGQRERDLDHEGGAAALDRVQLDRAADLLDVGAHHVHADAAAGHGGDLRRGREAGLEDEFVNLLLRQGLGLGLGGQAAGDCLLP